MSKRKIDRVSRRKGRISWWLTGLVALPLIVLTMGLSAATAYALLQEGPSAGTGAAGASVVPPVDSLPVVALGVSPTATVMPTATVTNTPEPTATEVAGPLTFLGDFEAIYDFTGDTTPACGGGSLTLIGSPDPSDPLKVLAVTSITEDGLTVVGINVNTFNDPEGPLTFDLNAAVDANGAFSKTLTLQATPTLSVDVTFAGTFDFGVDPATVAGSLTFNLAGTDICVAGFTATFQAGPPPTSAPGATATPGPSLPATGSSGGSSSDGALWAVVAGTVGLFALGTAGVASLRRRRA